MAGVNPSRSWNINMARRMHSIHTLLFRERIIIAPHFSACTQARGVVSWGAGDGDELRRGC